MANGIKYQAHELLNKVLNAGEDALNVDLSDSVTVTVDSEFPAAAALADNSGNPTTTSVGSHLLGYDSGNTNWNRVEVDDVGHLQVDVLTITAGDNNIGNVDIASIAAGDNNIGNVDIASSVALTVDLGSNNDIKIVSGQVESGAFASGALASGSVADGAMVTLGAKADAKNAATDGTAITAMQVLKQISSSVQILEDWDDSDFANVNINIAGSDIAVNAGTMSAQTPRVTIATNDSHFGAVGAAADVDGVIHGQLRTIGTAVELIDDTVAVLGTATYSEATTKGSVVGAVRNDTLAPLAGTDNEIAPLQVNKSGALYTVEETGQLGSIFENTTTSYSSKQIVAIQFLEDTKFTTLTTDSTIFPGTASGDNGIQIDNNDVFPQGMTIFGKWTAFQLASGSVIAYQGAW